MESLGYSLMQSLSLLFLVFSICAAATHSNNIPRLGTTRRTSQREPSQTTSSSSDKNFLTFYYTQQLDHFNYRPDSYTTFQQRYVVNFKYWGGADSNAPIFAYLGAEASLDDDLSSVGFLNDNALHFKALQVFIEHRYYGESVPFGSMKKALKNASTRGYFNSAQAIADYAIVLLQLKKKLSAENSPVIAIGGSYGGMLAAWFRLKYPHIVLGSLASSAPILYFDGISPQVGYYSIVTKDFQETSKSCYETIRKSWTEIDRVASRPRGLSTLSKRFNTCGQLNTSDDLKDYLEYIITEAAQYNSPPTYPVSAICSAIDGATVGTDTLGRIYAGVVAYKQSQSCYDTNEYNYPTETNEGWGWQTCSEMVMPIGIDSNASMFPPQPFNLNEFINTCKRKYGVQPRPHWVTTYYGGRDLKLILHRFASNIIFSNGLKDPYSSGGVLENISDSIVAVSTVNGSHCLDILEAKRSDPQWLVQQRKTEVEIIEKWIAEYQADLLAFK
uniref:Birch protein n=1 Tax=Betula platyphylla TaxID=78630 RepID=A0A9E9L796_BETPL|nr:birch protein [Betula platyphylla]